MYTAYFGLTEPPFSIAPDPRYLYMSERHREALAHLLYGIGERGGFVQLTGEVGTGKTTLCRCLLEQLPPHVDVALVFNPRLTSLELLATICDELKIAYPPGTTSHKTLVDALYRYLLEAHERGRRTVLIIDEAQDLSAEVLEEIRLLTNLETSTRKLLQVILIGQPELVRLLERPGLRQVAQRIMARYHLTALSRTDTAAYIRHRIEVAGCTERLFTAAAARHIHRLSRGIPRLINVISDRALLGAYVENKKRVDPATVRRAGVEVLRGAARPSRPRATAVRSAGLAVMLAIIAVAALAIATGGQIGVRLMAALDQAGQGIWAPAARSSGGARGAHLPEVGEPSGRAQPVKAVGAVKLDAILRTPSIRSDQQSALAALYRRWRPGTPERNDQLECDAGRLRELGCAARSGTWRTLRRYNLPAVLELTLPGGEKRYAVVTALGAETATLELGNRQVTVPIGEVDLHWEGGFILLWEPPPLGTRVIRPGAPGADVKWLRERLGEIDGPRAPAPEPAFYDEELKGRVVAFQRSRSLVADGVVGPETVIHLSAALNTPGVPTLSAATR